MKNYVLLMNLKVNKKDNCLEKIKIKVKSKISKKIKFFSSILLAQIFWVQYCTYVTYSWDIMEPIACLLGNE